MKAERDPEAQRWKDKEIISRSLPMLRRGEAGYKKLTPGKLKGLGSGSFDEELRKSIPVGFCVPAF